MSEFNMAKCTIDLVESFNAISNDDWAKLESMCILLKEWGLLDIFPEISGCLVHFENSYSRNPQDFSKLGYTLLHRRLIHAMVQRIKNERVRREYDGSDMERLIINIKLLRNL